MLLINSPPSYRVYHSTQGDTPRDIYDAIEQASCILNLPSKIITLFNVFNRSTILFSFNPTLLTVLHTVIHRKTIYLCWGINSDRTIKGFLSRLKLRIIFKLSKVVLVNDIETKIDIEKFGVQTKLVPYPVDTNFFRCESRNFEFDIICIGNNDRDESIVLSLANQGYKVARITRDPKVLDFYKDSKLVNLYYNLSYVDLRKLICLSRLMIMPIKKKCYHAAGQTSILEGLSCGKKIVILNSRLTDSFKNKGLFFCDDERCFFEIIPILLQEREESDFPNTLDSFNTIENFAKILSSNIKNIS
jgi:hypothetical protein